MAGEIKNFTDLIAWQKAHTLVLEIYKITKLFPEDERFALTNQLRRAAVSITSNVAEGFGRNTPRDKVHFYSIAKGSLLETQSQLLVAKDLGYLENASYEILEPKIIEVAKLLSGLKKHYA